MPRHLVKLAVFLIGLAAVCGIAIGYIGSNALAFVVTLLIGGCYVVGALELKQFQQTTDAFEQALDALKTPPMSLVVWIDGVPPNLRHAVRARVEGERAALPGPALTPYLVGLLVLLGMLGTLLGMVVTLHGTGAALESATDLSAIRASLAAPVTGLGFAFGTSIAGVATSAMLGLLSALCRRERLHAAHTLDTRIATTLRAFTQTHRREEAFRLMQKQAELMPKLAEHLHAMMSAIEQQSAVANERQIANQDAFHAKTETAYRRLATSVELSLKQSVADSARAASAALQPIMQATMDGIARESAALHGSVEHAVARQLDGLTAGFEASASKVADIWSRSLDAQRDANEAVAVKTDASLERFAQTFETRSATLVDAISVQMIDVKQGLEALVAKHAQASDAHVEQMAASMERFSQAFDARSSNLVDGVAAQMQGVRSGIESLVAKQDTSMERFVQTFEQRSTNMIDGVAARMENVSSGMSDAWRDALAQQTQSAAQLAAQNEQALTAASATFEQHAASLLRSMDRAHGELRAELTASHEARLGAWTDALAALAATLREEWQTTSTFAASRQQEICDTLARTANDISAQSEAHASATIAQIEQLVQAASEAPKAAAEVIAELRQKLSDSMVRDTAMLDERARLLSTLETLLDAVNHASTEQRAAVDALVAGSADLLERVGTQFTGKVEAETAKLNEVAAQVTGSAVEVASLSDAFGAAVQAFGASNETLVAHLERVEAALDKSLTRSDEQLAYYVAQAREVIDLSMMSQKQIVENLQHIAGQRAAPGARAA
ncbi:chemotaxis protein [Caballeronia peredens]|nr:chemotaxis protein [Caballeronia peredens]